MMLHHEVWTLPFFICHFFVAYNLHGLNHHFTVVLFPSVSPRLHITLEVYASSLAPTYHCISPSLTSSLQQHRLPHHLSHSLTDVYDAGPVRKLSPP